MATNARRGASTAERGENRYLQSAISSRSTVFSLPVGIMSSRHQHSQISTTLVVTTTADSLHTCNMCERERERERGHVVSMLYLEVRVSQQRGAPSRCRVTGWSAQSEAPPPFYSKRCPATRLTAMKFNCSNCNSTLNLLHHGRHNERRRS